MNILAIGAHPDDIEFGCGGTLIKLAQLKYKVSLFIATEGEIGAKKNIRNNEQVQACNYIGIKKVYWAGFQDTKVPTDKDLIDKIEEALKEVKPDIVFFNYPDDVHQDHRAVANCALSATRYMKKVLFYEVPTSQNFEPDLFVDISDVMNRKLQLLKIHKSQVKRTRVPRLTILESAKSCAIFRGYHARVKYAEGFKSLRFMLDLKKGKV